MKVVNVKTRKVYNAIKCRNPFAFGNLNTGGKNITVEIGDLLVINKKDILVDTVKYKDIKTSKYVVVED